MSKKDKNNQNINSIPKYLLGNYFKKPIKWLAHLINDYGNSKHPFITTGTSYAYAIGDEKRRHPELTELQVRENIDLRIKQNRKKLGLPTENTPSLAAAGLALGSLYYPWLAIPDIIFDTAASIDEPSTSNNLHTIADFPETVAKFTPSKIDDYVAKGVLTLGNIDDAVSTSGRNMFSIFDKKTGKINNTIDKTSVRESTNIRYRKNGGQIRKMQTAAGGGLVYDDGKNIERTNYNNWSKLSFVDKMKRRFNIAKHLFNESSSPIVNSVGAIFGEYDPENPDLNTGIVNAPGRATPQLVLSSVLTINKFKNIFKNYNPYAYRKPKLPEIKISDKIIDDVKNIKINPDDLFTDNFVKYLEKQTRRKIKRIPYKNTKDGNIYKEGFSFVDENGKEIAHIAGNLKGKNVWVESSYVDPEFRHKGLGKLMYFDFNDNVYNTYGTTLHSSALLRVGYVDGGGMSPSNRLWKSLTDNKLATTEGSGFDWWNIMVDPSKIKTAYRKQGGKMNIVEQFKKGRILNTKKYYDKSILYRLYKSHRES